VLRRGFLATPRILTNGSVITVAPYLFRMAARAGRHLALIEELSEKDRKQLRLQEARRLLLNDNVDVATAGFRVGYENPSHFNREYRRLFGTPPGHDLGRLRSLHT
jgi:AraC-like DNA-binding protein